LYFGLNDFVLFGAAIFVNLGAAAKDIATLVRVGTVESSIPFSKGIHIPGAIFRAQNGWKKRRSKIS
jgi:hypothetical protein